MGNWNVASGPRIFISYRREDSQHAASRLAEDLRRHFARGQVFQDFATIDPGADFVEVIERGLASCAAVLVVIGPSWLSAADSRGRRKVDLVDDWVRHEVAESLRRSGVRVFPVLVDDARMPAAEDLPDILQPLTRRQAFPLAVRHWEKDIAELVEHLRRVPGLGSTRRGLAPSRLIAWGAGIAVVAALGIAVLLGSRSGESGKTTTTAAATTPEVAPAAREAEGLAAMAKSLLQEIEQQRRDLVSTAQAAARDAELQRTLLAAAGGDGEWRTRQVGLFEAEERQAVAEQVTNQYANQLDGEQGVAALSAKIDQSAREAKDGDLARAKAQYQAVIGALAGLQALPAKIEQQVVVQRDGWLQALAGQWAEDDCRNPARFALTGRKLQISWPPHGDVEERVLKVAPAEVITVVTTAGRYQGRLSRYVREGTKLTIASIGSDRSIRLKRCG